MTNKETHFEQIPMKVVESVLRQNGELAKDEEELARAGEERAASELHPQVESRRSKGRL
jgi:ElaB/YqjD/DUF883 family membrane-anchored ribosome-binding protein